MHENEFVGDPAPAAPPPNPRQIRARRRRRRRQIGTALFILVAIGVFGAAYLALNEDDSSENAVRTTGAAAGATTTTVAPLLGPYKVTTGVNVRQGPGTSFPSSGVIETGKSVFVACVIEGEAVDGPAGPNSQWLRISGFGPTGYLISIYVTTGDDLRTNKIPTCPAV